MNTVGKLSSFIQDVQAVFIADFLLHSVALTALCEIGQVE